MTDEHRDRLAGYLRDAAGRFHRTVESEGVYGLDDRTLAAKVSGPARCTAAADLDDALAGLYAA
ncbi:hypothetical protein [Myceligenerans pegani]|uniref:Uncharacterized protein n=1 Tax=Myceligenerans pegani TaxID=2776917 RepID=A0ABR9N0N9_9MICO|nr:hypothetical protein [Myceligenerans sp. TRM 65318]MBE1876638.1 hypothetical protein [Myceligenerans sp. TRM 65318]MBE3018909.1 hypothetical protein [Myceligenerans sp. TRM 65318]